MNELKQHIITALDLAQTHLDEGNIEGALICQQGALRQVAALLGGETETTVLEGATVDCGQKPRRRNQWLDFKEAVLRRGSKGQTIPCPYDLAEELEIKITTVWTYLTRLQNETRGKKDGYKLVNLGYNRGYSLVEA